ncbi:ABC proline/glycine betaine transporter, periplasmic ligand binding protein [Caballeronia hypogeia]|uniref:ABC proline/glycine betaine transporter, periplasmic ligand binding protein n=1 Tax=Caballeronia hypogeia TaxID=1777140 RepID=A0A158CLQ5_9BURK|nr:glycine betaine ABC transporter substrate-binding protein [Caballeronia hypogeia]SAK83199.1 ABC proline/glycine betaine transporter, periplasmic ligand binding protein [Caballeronia hypogeia]
MKLKLFGALAVAGVFCGASQANAASCGNVTIASMNWQSAELEAAVDKVILGEGYGCQVNMVIGDTVPTITSMVDKAKPDIVSEGAIDLLPAIVKQGIDAKKIVMASKVIQEGAVYGWYIPKYFADAHPEIRTIPDALKHPELFPDPENPGKGAIYNGPQGWGMTVNTAQLFKAYKADKAGFRLIDTGSAAGLDGALAKAYEHKQPWLGVYWSPTSLLGKYQMVKLEAGVPVDEAEWKRCTTVADCPDPKPTAWPPGRLYTLIAKPFADKASPDVMKYLNTRTFKTADVQQVMVWMTNNQATGEDGAKRFLKEKQDVWTKWVTPDAAEKIKASL